METDARTRIVEAAARLLVEGGPDAVSTRAITSAANVHAPAIYRFFADKDDLMDAAATHALTGYLSTKTALEPTEDPVEDFQRAWELHIGFGLEHPDAYAMVYGTRRRSVPSEIGRQVEKQLSHLLRAMAQAGRLAVSEDEAAALTHAVGRGTVLTLIGNGPSAVPEVLVRNAFTMLMSHILVPETVDPPRHDVTPAMRAATTLRASLSDLDGFTDAEELLMAEWLRRVQNQKATPSPGRAVPRSE